MQPTGSSTTPVPSTVTVFGTASSVLDLAESSRWRAPDVTAALAEHASRLARSAGDAPSARRAEAWLTHGMVTIGHGVTAVPRAVEALTEAVRAGDLEVEARLRVELASVSRELGDRANAAVLLAPVRNRVEVTPALRADVCIEAVLQLDEPGWQAQDLIDAAANALRDVGGEAGTLGLGRLDTVLARQLRQRGLADAALERAREGLRKVLGDRLAGGALEPVSPHLALDLCVELCLALADAGHPDSIREIARPMLRWHAGPASMAPAARLRLALATRVHLPAGERDAARSAALWVAEAIGSRNLPDIESECHGLLAELWESGGNLSDALAASKKARAAERSHSTAVERALTVLAGAGGVSVSPTPDSLSDRPGRRSAPTPALSSPPPTGSLLPGSLSNGPAFSGLGLPDVGSFVPNPDDVHSNERTSLLRPVFARPGVPELSDPELSDPSNGHSRANGTSVNTRWIEPLSGPDLASSGERKRTGRRRAEDADAGTQRMGIGGAVGRGRPSEPASSMLGGKDPIADPAVLWLPAGAEQENGPLGSSARSGRRHSTPDPQADESPALLPERGVGPVPSTEPTWLSVPELAARLGEQAASGGARPSHLVVVDVATPDGMSAGQSFTTLALRIADRLREQVTGDARLYLLKPDAVVIAVSEADAQAVTRWVRSVSSGLSQRWSELSAELPRATFRIAVRPLDGQWSMERHVKAVHERLHGVTTQRDGSVADPPLGDLTQGTARHGALIEEPSAPTTGSEWMHARPGSGGRRRRPEEGNHDQGADGGDRISGLPQASTQMEKPDPLIGRGPWPDPLAGPASLAASEQPGEPDRSSGFGGPSTELSALRLKAEQLRAQLERDAAPSADVTPRSADHDALDQGAVGVAEVGDIPWRHDPTEGAESRTRGGSHRAGSESGGVGEAAPPTYGRHTSGPESSNGSHPEAPRSHGAPTNDAVTDGSASSARATHDERPPEEEKPRVRPSSWDKPVSELSFAELIDGALAAYREA